MIGHFYKNIQGWFSFEALYKRVVADAVDGHHFVEVGAWKGRSASFMAVEILNSGKKIRFDCVDTWKGSDELKHQTDPDVRAGRLFQIFLRNIRPVARTITVVRKPSVEAAKDYSAGSLDFIFIDGDHRYECVVADIDAWWPKLKPGGVMAGDDYNQNKVARAVGDSFDGPIVQRLPGKGSGVQWLVRKSLADDRRMAVAG